MCFLAEKRREEYCCEEGVVDIGMPGEEIRLSDARFLGDIRARLVGREGIRYPGEPSSSLV